MTGRFASDPVDVDVSRLVMELREIGRHITANRSLRDTNVIMTRLVEAAVTLVPHVDGSGITQTEGADVRASHGSTDDIAILDALQAQMREGPCVSAAEDPPPHGIVVVEDLEGPGAARWPRFAPFAVAAGYRSIMSIGLSARGPVHTALNLYARSPSVFGRTSQAIASIFGLQAAALLEGAENAAHLGLALQTRGEIGQALGIFMERYKDDESAAFERLAVLSQSANVKLLEVAPLLIQENRAPG